MKNRSLSAPTARNLLLASITLALVTLGLTSCGQVLYKFPQYNFANRPIPPSKLAQRVMVSVTSNGSSGFLQILDGLRDIRNNLPNTITTFPISGYAGGYPNLILNFPEQSRGYVYSDTDGSVGIINYGTEASAGSAGTFPARSSSLAIPGDFVRYFSAEETIGELVVFDNSTGRSFALNLPNVYKVASNQGDTIALAMVRNSNSLYRIIKLNAGTIYNPGSANPLFPANSIDCQPYSLPVYCVVPVPGTYDRPVSALFSLDGTTAYVINCGRECGGTTSSVSLLQQQPLNIDAIPNPSPYPTIGNVPIPGGSTLGLSDGTNLYLAGQQLQPDGLFAGRLTAMNLSTLALSAPVSISDGNHLRMLFADDNTLWIGSEFCATGEKAHLGQNYNCLTRVDLGTMKSQTIPANVVPGSTTAGTTVPYPNGDQNLYYYGSLTGLCWVQNYHKVYTAYGGQVHAFNTADGTEINNQFITVQGTALDVAYMDAITNAAN